jgi:hypothetical protein
VAPRKKKAPELGRSYTAKFYRDPNGVRLHYFSEKFQIHVESLVTQHQEPVTREFAEAFIANYPIYYIKEDAHDPEG